MVENLTYIIQSINLL